MSDIVILDSGAHSIKIGFGTDTGPKLFPNAIYRAKNSSRLLISDEIKSYRDKSSLFYLYPHDNGYTLNWDVQRTVWEHIIHDKLLLECTNLTAVVTEPEFDPQSNQRAIDEIFFEEYGFKGLCRINGSNIVSDRYAILSKAEGCVIVESGHSFTHIVPYWKGRKVKEGVMRLDIGGKLLTNYLKESLSYRQLNLMDEFMVTEQIKEAACYSTLDYKKDMQNKQLNKLFILPDFTTGTAGRLESIEKYTIKSTDQFIRLNKERFQIPEIIFNPGDGQIDSCGIHEAVHLAILKCPKDIQPILYRNIMLTGGNCSFPNFKVRLLNGIRGKILLSF